MSLDLLSLTRLRKLVASLNNLELPCTLFVTPHTALGQGPNTDEFAECLVAAMDSGHEIAQHGHDHHGNSFMSEFGCLLPVPFPSYEIQKERIETGMKGVVTLTGVRPKGFRAPFYLHNRLTLRALSDLHFLYDSSKTIFKPTHWRHPRVRVMLEVRPFRVENVLEIPVTGDYTYQLNNSNLFDSLRGALRDFEWARSHDAVFVLNNHPGRVDVQGLYSFLSAFVSKIVHKTDFIRLADVCRLHR